MSYSGLVTVALPVGSDGKLAGTPFIRPFGLPVEEDRDDFIADATNSAERAYDPSLKRGQVARSGAAGGSPLRDSLDRQEAARRGHAGSFELGRTR